MKVKEIKAILENLDDDTEVFIKNGEDAYPAKVRLFAEREIVPYFEIERIDEHRNYPAPYGVEEKVFDTTDNKSNISLLNQVADAWESIGEGHYSVSSIEKWLADDMKPAIDDIRRKLGRPTEKE